MELQQGRSLPFAFDAEIAPKRSNITNTWIKLLPTLAWAYSFVFFALSRLGTALSPGRADAELFAYIGREWHRGVIPIRQIWDDKPPAIFVVNLLASYASKQFSALAVFEFVALICMALLIARTLRMAGCKPALSWVAPFVAANVYSIAAYSLGGNYTEIYILPFAVLSIFAFLHAWWIEGRTAAWLLLSGVSAGFAAAFKPVGMAPLLALSAFVILVWQRDSQIKKKLLALLLPWLGFISVWAVIGLLSAQQGAAKEMFQAAVTYNLSYASRGPSPLMRPLLTLDRLLPAAAIFGFALAALAIWSRRRWSISPQLWDERKHAALLLGVLWFGADICGANAGGRFYLHYFLPALLSLTFLASLGADGVFQVLTKLSRRNRYVLGAALMFPIALMGVRGQVDQYHALAANQTEAWQRAAAFVRDHRAGKDTLFDWEFTPGVYRISSTHTTTRLASAHYIDDFPGAYASIGNELLRELKASPPSYVIYNCDLQPMNSRDSVRRGFLEFVAKGYHRVYQTSDECVVQHN